MSNTKALLFIFILFNTQVLFNYAESNDPGGITSLYVSGVLVDAPECTIGTDNQITVDFGSDINIKRLDGYSYSQIIHWPLSCQTLLENTLVVTIKGEQADFDSSLLKTSIPGLGIRLKSDGKDIEPGEGLPFLYGMQPELTAVLTADDSSELRSGSFTGNATMVIGYQ